MQRRTSNCKQTSRQSQERTHLVTEKLHNLQKQSAISATAAEVALNQQTRTPIQEMGLKET